jgi:radical SAM superfamily enzyme YgiQ (UPF0313 family)
MEQAMRAAGLHLFTLESRRPLAAFDVLGFSLPYELLYTNLLNMLHLAGIPVLSRERTEAHPLVIAGGGAAYNPEPMADFVDAFVLGDGEDVVVEISAAVREAKRRGRSRQALLQSLSEICGLYAPSFYQVSYHDDGTVAGVRPTVAEAESAGAQADRGHAATTGDPPVGAVRGHGPQPGGD